ncbi:Uncharacterized protein conserved in bacteria [Haemophilus pittmaniae]|uniref:Uncharacterized protein conserved in bacteria n=1 Tax=Haemophilus pittmaniae TaxID=249188 RepID=A0A377J1C8_9PAST|nr:endonuclease/exonuclease/phosphatase family protein [Haemophilus pittmaniae]STO94068.1 Uncharacterized protein conserved in bacteria [Haemophilus pittmaniae]
MGRKVKIALGSMVTTMALAGYFLSQLTIFDKLQIQFVSGRDKPYQAITQYAPLQCYQSPEAVAVLPAKTFKLLSWNIHKGQDAGWQKDLQRLSAEQDFVLLQEATPQQSLQQFSSSLFASAFAYKAQSSGVKTFAKSAPQWYCADSLPEPWIQIPKVGSAMAFPLQNGQTLLVVNLHLINFELKLVNYRKQLEQIFTLVGRHQGPMIVAGDFNSWRGKRVDFLNRLMAQYDLHAVPLQSDQRVRFLGQPLDHVFSRGVQILTANVLAVKSSDHNPILLEFRIGAD